jgi:hypothetical protein
MVMKSSTIGHTSPSDTRRCGQPTLTPAGPLSGLRHTTQRTATR